MQCDICKREFTEKYNLTRHVKSQHLCCQRCSQTFNRRDNYEMHQRVRLLKLLGNGERVMVEDRQGDSEIIQVVLVVLSVLP